MTELAVKGDLLLSIWCAQTWRVWAGSIPIIILMNLLLRAAPEMGWAVKVATVPVVLVWNFVALGMALRKKYSNFRTVLVPLSDLTSES